MFNKLIALALLLLVGGCGALPDAKPFADATSVLAASVKSSGAAMTESLRESAIAHPRDKVAITQTITTFESLWAERTKAMDAAADYSKAIAEIVAAGGAGGETARKTGDALQGLAAAVGIVSPVTGIMTEIGVFVYSRIAMVRASRTLEEAVAQAQPAINAIAKKLTDELGSDGSGLKGELARLHAMVVSGVGRDYDADLDMAKALQARRKTLMDGVLNGSSKSADLQDHAVADGLVQARLKQRDEKLAISAQAYKTRMNLLNAMSSALDGWSKAHRDLAAAIREKRKVSVAELESTIVELRDLLKKVREL